MTQWLVQLTGEEEDLKALSKIFCSPNLNVGKDDDSYYYLRSLDFASINDESAREERAKELVRNTNVAARLLLGDNYFAVEFDAMARIEEDGRRYRSVGKSLQTNWHVRTFYNDASPEEAKSLITVLDDQGVSQIIRLFAQSLDRKDDRFKRFLYGWKALEIFITKVFNRYERTFIDGLGSGDNVPGADRYLRRAMEVMKGKYSLVDKFSIVAAVLAGPSNETDTVTFTRLKDFRDALVHRPDVAEASLPTCTVELQSLLSKYLRLHLEHANS